MAEKMMYCPTCEKGVKAIPKVFNVRLCPYCNKILASDHGMDKVNG